LKIVLQCAALVVALHLSQEASLATAVAWCNVVEFCFKKLKKILYISSQSFASSRFKTKRSNSIMLGNILSTCPTFGQRGSYGCAVWEATYDGVAVPCDFIMVMPAYPIVRSTHVAMLMTGRNDKEYARKFFWDMKISCKGGLDEIELHGQDAGVSFPLYSFIQKIY
jgi:hypothetical protein